jgi:hypothetical protein
MTADKTLAMRISVASAVATLMAFAALLWQTPAAGAWPAPSGVAYGVARVSVSAPPDVPERPSPTLKPLPTGPSATADPGAADIEVVPDTRVPAVSTMEDIAPAPLQGVGPSNDGPPRNGSQSVSPISDITTGR